MGVKHTCTIAIDPSNCSWYQDGCIRKAIYTFADGAARAYDCKSKHCVPFSSCTNLNEECEQSGYYGQGDSES